MSKRLPSKWLSVVRRMARMVKNGDLRWDRENELEPRTYSTLVGSYVVVFCNPVYFDRFLLEIVKKPTGKEESEEKRKHGFFEVNRGQQGYGGLEELFNKVINTKEEDIDVRSFKDSLDSMEG